MPRPLGEVVGYIVESLLPKVRKILVLNGRSESAFALIGLDESWHTPKRLPPRGQKVASVASSCSAFLLS